MLNYAGRNSLAHHAAGDPKNGIDFENGEDFPQCRWGFYFSIYCPPGFPIPLHRDFEEVVLCVMSRRKSVDAWRRGVVLSDSCAGAQSLS